MSNVTNVENISDVEADQYLEEWSHADKARARSNISGGDLFRYGWSVAFPARFVDDHLICSVVCFPAASTMVPTPLNVQLTCTAASLSLRNLLR